MVAGAIKVYSWKNKTRTTKDFRELLEDFLKQNKTFSVASMETIWGYDRANPVKTRDWDGKFKPQKSKEYVRKQAYYYISKLLKKNIIKKTSSYEPQGSGEKPLVIYKVIK